MLQILKDGSMTVIMTSIYLGDIFSLITMTYYSPGLAIYVKVFTEYFMGKHLITLQATKWKLNQVI